MSIIFPQIKTIICLLSRKCKYERKEETMLSTVSVNTSSANSSAATSTANNNGQASGAKKATASPQKITDSFNSKEYGPVVSESTDGDTLQLKETTEYVRSISDDMGYTTSENIYDMQNFDLSSETIDEETINEEVVNDDRTTEEKYVDSLITYVGLSDSELKYLYLRGDISQIDFDQELNSRRARREAAGIEMHKLADKITTIDKRQDNLSKAIEAINNIENDNGSSTFSISMRMDALENLDTV